MTEAVDVDLFDEVPRTCGRVLLTDGPEVDRVARQLRDAAYEVIRCAPGQTAEMLAAAAIDEDVDVVVVASVVASAEASALVDELRRSLDARGSAIDVRGAGDLDLRTSGAGGARCS